MTEFRPFNWRAKLDDQKISWIPFIEPDFSELVARIYPEAVSANPSVHYSNAFWAEFDAVFRLFWMRCCDCCRCCCCFAFWWFCGGRFFGRFNFVSSIFKILFFVYQIIFTFASKRLRIESSFLSRPPKAFAVRANAFNFNRFKKLSRFLHQSSSV